MVPKCVVLLLVIVAVESATLQGRTIPVEVRYERLEHNIGPHLEEKIQLSEEDIKVNNLRNLTPTINHNSIRNFDEKVQLSPEQLLQFSKHIPVNHDVLENEHYEIAEKLGELPAIPQPESKSDTISKTVFIQTAQDIVEKGLENLRKNFVPADNELTPTNEEWEKLDSQVKEYFAEEASKLGSRQQEQVTQPQNIFQNIANGIQQVTNNFVQQFQGQTQNPPPAVSGDEAQAPQQQGPVQGFIGYFTGGVQNIVSNIQNIAQGGPQAVGNNTVLGDNGAGGQQPGNFIGNVVSNVQQFFQGPGSGNNQGNGTQGDTAGGGSGGVVQQGFFAGAISQINQVVSNFIPSPAPSPPAVQGDEGTNIPASNQPAGPFQQVVQSFGNIGTAFNQFIQGGQQPNKPPGSEDENAANQPPNQNFIQSIGQNIGNAFQNIQNQFRPPSIGNVTLPGVDSSNPIVGQVSNIGNQIQQIAGQQAGSNPIQNLIPGSSPSASKQPAEEQPEAAPTTIEQTETLPDEANTEKKGVLISTE